MLRKGFGKRRLRGNLVLEIRAEEFWNFGEVGGVGVAVGGFPTGYTGCGKRAVESGGCV